MLWIFQMALFLLDRKISFATPTAKKIIAKNSIIVFSDVGFEIIDENEEYIMVCRLYVGK